MSNMIESHKFLPAPFYPNKCDAYVDQDGTRRVCARPGREHASTVHAPPHHPTLRAENGQRFLQCAICLIWLGDLAYPVGMPPAVQPTAFIVAEGPRAASIQAAIVLLKEGSIAPAIQLLQDVLDARITE